jgi:hypothetical protein
MKINFKKVASVLAATAMLGSTIAFAGAALSMPASDWAVVYGASTDNAAALDMASVLTSSSTTTIEGDNVKLEKSTNLFNLGEDLDDFYSTLDEEELSSVLAEGVYENDANNEYDYTQEIALGTGLTLEHFQESDFNDDMPVLGFNLNSGDHILNYTLEFTPDEAEGGAAFVELQTTDLEMLGRSYYIVKAEGNSNGVKLTLLDNANTAIVSQGETKTLAVGSNSYSVDVDYIDGDNVILSVDGVSTNKLGEGDVFKVATDTYVAVKNILFDGLESSTKKVEISLGTGKIVLENGQEVEMNGEKISELDKYQDTNSEDAEVMVYITNSTTDISELVLEWTLGNDAFIAPGSDLVLPGFETIKIAMTGFNMPNEEMTSLEANGDDKFRIKTTITDGDVDLDILYMNDSLTGIEGLGEKAKHKLVTVNSASPAFALNETENSYFVVSYVDGDDFETYAFEIDSITDDNGKNATVLTNLAGGSDLSFKEVSDDDSIGNIDFTLTSADDDAKTALVTASTTGAGTLSGALLVTSEGLRLRLPYQNTTALADGGIPLLGVDPTSWVMNITEEDKDGNVALGDSVLATIAVDADDGLEVSSLSGLSTYETEDGSDKYVGYVVSELATMFSWDRPSSGLNTLDITYAGEESSADVYVSETGASMSTTSTVAPVMADAMTAADKAKNLIVVGGSCINAAAAKLITGLETPVCAADFTAQTGITAGQYMIKGYDSPYADNKIAVLVAGYEAAQTVDAVKAAKAMSSLTGDLDEVGPALA